MPYSYEDVMLRQERRLLAERSQAVAELEAARTRDDIDGCDIASDAILDIDRKYQRLCEIGNEYVSRQASAQPQNKFGLNEDEIAIAHGISGGDRTLTNEQREQIYAEQRGRHQHLVATGQYGGSAGGRSK